MHTQHVIAERASALPNEPLATTCRYSQRLANVLDVYPCCPAYAWALNHGSIDSPPGTNGAALTAKPDPDFCCATLKDVVVEPLLWFELEPGTNAGALIFSTRSSALSFVLASVMPHECAQLRSARLHLDMLKKSCTVHVAWPLQSQASSRNLLRPV